MRIKEKLLDMANRLVRRLEDLLGQGALKKTEEIRQEILQQVKSAIVVEHGTAAFPYEKLSIQLNPPTLSLREAFRVTFLEKDSLKAEIRQALVDAGTEYPENLQITVKMSMSSGNNLASSPDAAGFYLQLEKVQPLPGRDIPEAKLVVTRGVAEHPEYRTKKGGILIGNIHEVVDREGRVVRRNDLVFIDNGDEINSTVSRVHARIWFDPETREFYVMDEVSRYGTRVVRGNVSMEVPSGNLQGVPLKPGDEVFFGQASVRFEFPPS